MARTHNRVSSRIWTGRTARELRAHPPYVRVFQHWLLENESAIVEPYGLYHLQLDLAVLQIGGGVIRTDLEASLELLERLEFCHVDQAAEWIWIKEMAAHQVLEGYQPLKERDWRIRAAQKFYAALPNIAQLGPFFDQYSDLLRLEVRREYVVGLVGISPSRPLKAPQGANPTPTPTPTPTEMISSEIKGDLLESPNGETAMVRQLAQLDHARAAFEAWWELYPIKSGKGKAWTSWLKHPPPVAQLMDTTRAYIDSEEWKPRGDGRAPIPYPATFLNGTMWEDTPTPRSGRVLLADRNREMAERTSAFVTEGATHGSGHRNSD